MMRLFATIKKPTQASDVAHVGVDLPLTAKSMLHDKHCQRDKNTDGIFVELEREYEKTSHSFSFLTPNVSALGVYCVERSRTRRSEPLSLSAINATLQEKAFSVYTEAHYA